MLAVVHSSTLSRARTHTHTKKRVSEASETAIFHFIHSVFMKMSGFFLVPLSAAFRCFPSPSGRPALPVPRVYLRRPRIAICFFLCTHTHTHHRNISDGEHFLPAALSRPLALNSSAELLHWRALGVCNFMLNSLFQVF